MNKRNWLRRLPCLGISAFFLLGSSAVYADTLRHPQMSLIQDGFNTQQKLNLTIYNPNIKLTHQGVICPHFSEELF